MSKPFEFRDFSKRYKDLSSNNFPTTGKDTIKFKFSSKAQKGVALDSSVTNTNSSSTDSEFGVKLTFDEVPGVELGYKVKSKPATELNLRFDDRRIPLEGSSFTFKMLSQAPSEQTVGGTFNYGNRHVALNLGVSVPLKNRLYSFIKDDQEALNKQVVKVDFDFVARPVEDRDIFVGAEVKTQLPQSGNTSETNQLLYSSNVSLGLNNKTTNAGLFVDHQKANKDNTISHTTSYGAWVFTQVDDLSGGSRVTYNPSEKDQSSKGLSFELVGGLQRDANSKLSTKVTVVPTTTVSLGYEQKLSANTKLTFGYAFLLNNTTGNNSNYSFGLELSH